MGRFVAVPKLNGCGRAHFLKNGRKNEFKENRQKAVAATVTAAIVCRRALDKPSLTKTLYTYSGMMWSSQSPTHGVDGGTKKRTIQ